MQWVRSRTMCEPVGKLQLVARRAAGTHWHIATTTGCVCLQQQNPMPCACNGRPETPCPRYLRLLSPAGNLQKWDTDLHERHLAADVPVSSNYSSVRLESSNAAAMPPRNQLGYFTGVAEACACAEVMHKSPSTKLHDDNYHSDTLHLVNITSTHDRHQKMAKSSRTGDDQARTRCSPACFAAR